MQDEDKSKEQLITELKALRQRVTESEKDKTERKRAVVRVTPITHAHRLQLFAQFAFFKEPAEQTHATKSGQILPGELLLMGQILFFLLFLCYIRIHFSGASFSGSLNKRILPEKEAFLLNIM